MIRVVAPSPQILNCGRLGPALSALRFDWCAFSPPDLTHIFDLLSGVCYVGIWILLRSSILDTSRLFADGNGLMVLASAFPSLATALSRFLLHSCVKPGGE